MQFEQGYVWGAKKRTANSRVRVRDRGPGAGARAGASCIGASVWDIRALNGPAAGVGGTTVPK